MNLAHRLARIPALRDAIEVSKVVRARRATGFVMESSPGHFGSPIPDLKEIRRREDEVFVVPSVLAGIDLRERAQLELVRSFAEFYRDQPFEAARQEGIRYHFENSVFGYGDALVLHCMLRLNRPKRLVEIGSGFSSAVILDTNDLFLDGALSCTFVDPFPRRLYGLLREGDASVHEIVPQPVQRVPLATFDTLEAGDVLFIDSTHVSKVGSDVNRLVFDVLPRLAPGVLVHVHDIFYPFEYPRDWVYRGRAWNENYVMRAFLMFNADFEIVLFNSYLARFHAAEVAETMPLWAHKPGGSLWLRRVQ